jgi:hypothetical protein
MKSSAIQNIINETCEYTRQYIVKTVSGNEYSLINDECNFVETLDGQLVYHGDNGMIWIECEKIESISI